MEVSIIDKDRLNSADLSETRKLAAKMLVAVGSDKTTPKSASLIAASALLLDQTCKGLGVRIEDALRVADNMERHVRDIPWISETRAIKAFAEGELSK